MKTVKTLHPIPVILLMILGFLVGMVATALASGGPVSRPQCDDAPKAGTVELHPNGTANAIEQVTFTIPFCTDNLAAFATVDNGNTAGEATGAMPWGVEAVNVSMQLDGVSTAVYLVYWRVEPITQ